MYIINFALIVVLGPNILNHSRMSMDSRLGLNRWHKSLWYSPIHGNLHKKKILQWWWQW